MTEPAAAAVQLSMPGLSQVARTIWRRVVQRFQPKERLGLVEWSERYRVVAGGAYPGPFRWDRQPALRAVAEAYDDPTVREICAIKSSQFGWTSSIELNVIGYHIHQAPCAMVAVFPKDGAVKKFVLEKLDPTIEATSVLAALVPVQSRNSDNTLFHKGFPGGYLAMGGGNSPANVKSTDALVALACEPDDVSKDVKDQGDGIALIKARTKSYANYKRVIGGSPTRDEFSSMQEEMEKSDKRRLYVACPHCGHEQTLQWSQVKWLDDADMNHAVYGTHRADTARYACEGEDCGALWTDEEKNTAVRLACLPLGHANRRGGWRATAPFFGIAGFYLSELMSMFADARFESLVRRWLEAQHALKKGDDTKLKEFINGTLGEVYSRRSKDVPEADQLREKAATSTYPEWTTPAGGVLAEIAVDVQRGGEHSGAARLEYRVRCWGRGEESWLSSIGVLPGNPLEEAVWKDLDKILLRRIRNLGGGHVSISACNIDASDGMTSDAVYRYIRTRRAKMARGEFPTIKLRPVKGHNESTQLREIFSQPSTSIDVGAKDKASKHGLKLYMVGTTKAKDLIFGRLKLQGTGPGRMHVYSGVPDYYFEHLTAEGLVPYRGRMRYMKRAGKANEMLDCEVMGLHAAYGMRVHRMTDKEWDSLAIQLRQRDLLAPLEEPETQTETKQERPDPPPPNSPPPAAPAARPQLKRVSGFR